MISLISKSSTGKLRIAKVEYVYDKENNLYIIHRWTGQYKGKMTKGPDIIVDKGKVKRTLEEQVILQYNSLVKQYKDKGYKALEKSVENYSEDVLNSIVGNMVTSINGVPKPMLAKQSDKVTDQSIFNNKWYASRKIDGLRILIYMNDSGELHTVSRGGMNYDKAMQEILENRELINAFKNNPGLIMDGEGYHYGYSLQQINQVARAQNKDIDTEFMQFYWYDIVDTKKSFSERFEVMKQIRDELDLTYNPERKFKEGDLRIQFVPEIEVSGWNKIIELHNNYVEDGWEGVVLRNPDKKYTPNGRTNDMIKVKMYKTGEFKIIGYELGLRGSEDMVFILETSSGIKFKSKPWGDREQKQWYCDNFTTECLNKYSITKYFYLSDDNVPLQPSTIAVRLKEDLPE